MHFTEIIYKVVDFFRKLFESYTSTALSLVNNKFSIQNDTLIIVNFNNYRTGK